MPTWKKSSPALIAFFDKALPADPRVERRQMFGYPCAFVNGQLFTGLHQESMIVRLGEGERAELLKEKGATIFRPMPGRTMREYVALPPAMTAGEAKAWVARGFAYAAALPAKKKPAKKAAAKKSPAKKTAARRKR